MLQRILRGLGVPDEPADEPGPAPAEPRPGTSVAHDVVVVMAEPDSDRLSASGWARYVVAGALLVELSREGRLEVEGSGKQTRVSVVDPTPLGDPELDAALAVLATGVRERVVGKVRVLPSATRLVDRLVAEGVLVDGGGAPAGRRARRRVEASSTAGREVLLSRAQAAVRGEVADDRTAMLVSALAAGGSVKVLATEGGLRAAQKGAARLRQQLSDDQRALLSAVEVVAEKDSTDYAPNI